MTTNGNGTAPASTDINLVIAWSPSTGQVKVSFPQIDIIGVLGLLEMAKVVLMEQRAKAEQRVQIPDINVTRRIVS